MKRITLILPVIAVLTIASCGGGDKKVDGSIVTNGSSANAGDVDPDKLAAIEFEELEFDFGEVIEGQKVVHEYRFTNTGENPLVITSAKGSCGCTVPEYPKDPISPGASAVITVNFDSEGRVGPANKTVTLQANTSPNTHTLILKGNVLEE